MINLDHEIIKMFVKDNIYYFMIYVDHSKFLFNDI